MKYRFHKPRSNISQLLSGEKWKIVRKNVARKPCYTKFCDRERKYKAND